MRKITSTMIIVFLFAMGVYTAPYFYEEHPVKSTEVEEANKVIENLLESKEDIEVKADEKPIERETRDQKVISNEPEKTKSKEIKDKPKAVKTEPKKESKPKTEVVKKDTITKEKVTVNENVGYKSETKNDSSLDKGKTITKISGVKGVKEIVYEVTYTNGKETSRHQIDSKIIKNPVTEVIHVGTKVQEVNCSDLSESSALACLVNKARTSSGLSTLKIDSNLVNYAGLRAKEITSKFSHTRPNGEPYHSIGTSIHGENISFGYTSASAAHEGFMNSSGHRANNLRPEFKRIGTAMIQDDNGSKHWVILFGY